MTLDEKLKFLKHDLQRNGNNAQDEYLEILLQKSEEYIQKIKGIQDDGSISYDMCVIDLASFYFRKRNDSNAAIPPFIVHEMNALLLTQIVRENNDV